MNRLRLTGLCAVVIGILLAVLVTRKSPWRSRARFDRRLEAEAERRGLSPSQWVMEVLSREVAVARARREAVERASRAAQQPAPDDHPGGIGSAERHRAA